MTTASALQIFSFHLSIFNKLKETQDQHLLSLVHSIVALEITSVCLHDMSAVSDFSLLRSWCDERTRGTLNSIYITEGGFQAKTVCVCASVCLSLMYWVTLRPQSPTPVGCHQPGCPPLPTSVHPLTRCLYTSHNLSVFHPPPPIPSSVRLLHLNSKPSQTTTTAWSQAKTPQDTIIIRPHWPAFDPHGPASLTGLK